MYSISIKLHIYMLSCEHLLSLPTELLVEILRLCDIDCRLINKQCRQICRDFQILKKTFISINSSVERLKWAVLNGYRFNYKTEDLFNIYRESISNIILGIEMNHMYKICNVLNVPNNLNFNTSFELINKYLDCLVQSKYLLINKYLTNYLNKTYHDCYSNENPYITETFSKIRTLSLESNYLILHKIKKLLMDIYPKLQREEFNIKDIDKYDKSIVTELYQQFFLNKIKIIKFLYKKLDIEEIKYDEETNPFNIEIDTSDDNLI